MKINKAELQTALEKVKPGLASKELIEQSTSFAFLGDRVVTYNDEISISHPIKGMEGMQGAITAKALYDFLSRVKQEEIDLSLEKNQVVIKAGRSKAGLIFEQEVRLPIEEIGQIGKWKKLPEDFRDGLKLCHPCCSRDMSRPVLTCVNIVDDRIEAANSFQIIQYRMKKKLPGKGFLIPASAAKELVRYEIQELSLGESWGHFRTPNGTIFSCRTVEGGFPEIEAFLRMDGSEFSFPEAMKEALIRADVFARKESAADDPPVVTVRVKGGGLELSSKNEYGWFQEKMKTRHKEADFSFTVGIEFLISLFDKLQNCVITPEKIGFSGENWKHVIAVVSNEE